MRRSIIFTVWKSFQSAIHKFRDAYYPRSIVRSHTARWISLENKTGKSV